MGYQNSITPLTASPHERNLIAVALNERVSELGEDHPISYSGDGNTTTRDWRAAIGIVARARRRRGVLGRVRTSKLQPRLAANLVVKAPINNDPTRESFAEALVRFGETVTTAEEISELSAANEAKLAYDMETEQLGRIRAAAHFTVSGGEITRSRQIHDTWPIPAADAKQS